jgi:hypothetical protein
MFDLTCCVAYFNPGNFAVHKSRYEGFAQHMADSGVHLITVECIFPGQTFAVTEGGRPDHVQVFSRTPLWLKENLLNLGFARATTPYLMWSDLDLRWEDKDWASKTMTMLYDHAPIGQSWTHLISRGPAGQALCQTPSFGAKYLKRMKPLPGISPVTAEASGGQWAFTREAYDHMGGLYDKNILGDGDDVMAFSFLPLKNREVTQLFRPGGSVAWHQSIRDWQTRVQDIRPWMAIEGIVNHLWHGDAAKRGYDARWKILVEEGYNPDTDLQRNAWGVWECTKPRLCARIAEYFRSRQEDAQ